MHEAPHGTAHEGPGARARGPRVRRLLGLLVLVALPAAVLRGCVVDVYVIRSPSMEPAFRGGEDGGDHLLVLRRGADPRPTARWDVVILDGEVDPELPEALGSLLKRVVGLGGERVHVTRGEVFVDGAPARKPDALVAELLVPVHEGEGLSPPWVPLPDDGGRGETDGVPGDGAGGSRSSAATLRAAFDRPISDGEHGEPGQSAVRDTALEVLVGEGDGILWMSLRDGADVFRARLAPAASGGAAIHHNLGGGLVASAPDFPGLSSGQTALFWNVDDGLRLLVDGRVLLAADIASDAPPVPGTSALNGPTIEVWDGTLELRRVRVLRDLHYTSAGPYAAGAAAPLVVPPGHVLVLGDSSARSRDGRWFGPVPLESVRGRPIAIYAPWPRAGWLAPDGRRR